MSHERPHAEEPGGGEDATSSRPFGFRDDASLSRSSDAEFDNWLAGHPGAEDELTDLQGLRGLFHASLPDEPEERVWFSVQRRIHEMLQSPDVAPRRSPRPFWWLLGASAAAALLSVLFQRSLWQADSVPPQLAAEAYPVAEEDDVTIVSMEARDVAFLVVGQPPVSGDFVFARPEDIQVIKCECCPISGRTAQLDQEGEVPMFVSTTAGVEPFHDE
jgi:hypothetical protein